ncbi:electron transport complex subunit RsxC [Aeromonas simiae]|uniref:electron transport complex subunit RsxC n=1 Tax=Aeromonas simiae TaxID=218936 RepID=UPI00266BE92E|nr:electron transport complex subunit RsxC [Aeromonas simiae]MDO2949341.1 electron transport complex subunit RsxC [Aeromonas simiae]MDO2952805.1 electron transport complex subunit RsxC [Aeromonas simiae]MDO2956536.1 electron transport complex subunit RsxC [Aeromonas simiae]
MQAIIERIKAGAMWDFHGGIHPPENKTQSSHQPIREAGLPPELIIPVRQHAGPAGELLVQVGDRVKKGQPLTSWQGGRTVPVHASTSGTITAIGEQTVAHPSGLSDLCITLVPDGEESWCPRDPRPDYWHLERSELLARVQQAGIAGLGGAVFPTHSKLDGRGQRTEILIINGLECEPYITTDDRLMRDYAAEVIEGIRVLRHLLGPKLCLIGIEDNKPEAIAALTAAIGEHDQDIMVRVTPTKYPSGGAKQTIEILTGRQVPKGGRAVDIGIMVLNVATVFAIKRAIVEGEPLIERLVTLTGETFRQPGNVWVRLGTPVRWLLQRFELQPEAEQRVIMGGPMMGFTLPHARVPVVKATNCLLAPSRAELPPPGPEQACIRCSACADACPATLLPQELYWYSRAREYDKVEALNLFDCIECGACAWVCPSEIPLVQYYKIAKDDIRESRAEAEKAERAKARFEAKQARFEREKAAREARHASAAANRRQVLTEAAGGDDPVAAALARVKAKQSGLTTQGALPDGAPDNEAVIAARAARKREAEARRAAKLAEQGAAATPPASDAAPLDADAAKKAALAAALARAKAKKAASAQSEAPSASHDAASAQPTPAPASIESESGGDPEARKKAAVAAALARAKAKKAASAQSEAPSASRDAASAQPTPAPASTESESGNDPEARKKAAVAAAIARAKAKKAACAHSEAPTDAPSASRDAAPVQPTPASTESASHDDPEARKKAAVAAAIARAKAKKAASVEREAPAQPTPASTESESGDDPEARKKAAVAAAIARAKAKKAAMTQSNPTTADNEVGD